MPYKKGKTGNKAGRPAGSLNKTTASIKSAIEQTFHRLGGVNHMAKWAEKEPNEFYKLLSKLLPHEVSGKLNSDVTHTIAWPLPKTGLDN